MLFSTKLFFASLTPILLAFVVLVILTMIEGEELSPMSDTVLKGLFVVAVVLNLIFGIAAIITRAMEFFTSWPARILVIFTTILFAPFFFIVPLIGRRPRTDG